MLKLSAALLVLTVAVVSASAKTKDHPNSGYCKNGKPIADVANCPENKGKKK